MDEKMLLQAIQQIVKTEIEPLNGRMDEMSGRMDEMSSRIDRMENRMDRIEMRMDRMEGRMDRVEILLEHEIPLPVISEILGHTTTETTMAYLRIDISELRKCALEVAI